jgi:hypothetical protein
MPALMASRVCCRNLVTSMDKSMEFVHLASELRERLRLHPAPCVQIKRNSRKQQSKLSSGFFHPNPSVLPIVTSLHSPSEGFGLTSPTLLLLVHTYIIHSTLLCTEFCVCPHVFTFSPRMFCRAMNLTLYFPSNCGLYICDFHIRVTLQQPNPRECGRFTVLRGARGSVVG